MFEDITDIAAFKQIMVVANKTITCKAPVLVLCINLCGNLQDINYWGAVYMTHLAIPYLRFSRGKIVALSAPPAWLPAPRMSIYNVVLVQFREIFVVF